MSDEPSESFEDLMNNTNWDELKKEVEELLAKWESPTELLEAIARSDSSNPSITQAPTQVSQVQPKTESEIKTTRGRPKNKPYSKTLLKHLKVNPRFDPSIPSSNPRSDPRIKNHLKTKAKRGGLPPEALPKNGGTLNVF